MRRRVVAVVLTVALGVMVVEAVPAQSSGGRSRAGRLRARRADDSGQPDLVSTVSAQSIHLFDVARLPSTARVPAGPTQADVAPVGPEEGRMRQDAEESSEQSRRPALGRLLRVHRVRAQLTQEQLAERSGVSTRTIRALETGRVRRPQRESVRLLADALALLGGVRAEFLAAARDPAWAQPATAAGPAGAPGNLATAFLLPPDIPDFTGRGRIVARLAALLAGDYDGAARPTTVQVSAVAGKAGVGKTALAVHVAYRLRPWFPDGQLYVDLRGLAVQALDPAEVLGGFLRALGVDGYLIPDGVDERAGLYRSLLADRRVLVLLDNAADVAQIRPLLPAGAGNAVLITSRWRLAGLAVADAVDLEVLAPEQAMELLGRIAGPARVAAEPEAARAIAALCGGLPLALRVAGARLAAKPHWRLGRLASRLGEPQRRLEELAAGDLAVRASLALSYQRLGEAERRAFRLLGLLQVPKVAPWMLSVLLDVPAAEAEDVLERLADARLLDAVGEDATGQVRYRLHDLFRLFANERLAEEDMPATGGPALERTLRSYLTVQQESVRRLCLRFARLAGQSVETVPPEVAATLVRPFQPVPWSPRGWW